MWQVQWVLSLIPDAMLVFIYYSFFTVGIFFYIGSKIAGTFPFKFVPIIGQYKSLTELLGVLLLAVGAWFLGGYEIEMAWRDKVKQVEAKVEVAKKESKEANVVLQTKIVKQKEIVHEVQIQIQKEIQLVEKQIDAECKLDSVIPTIHNKAAKNPFSIVGSDNK
jgi:hypothetical protein